MTRTWGVGILGLGHWYSAYALARTLPEYPKAELRAAAWHHRQRLDTFATTFGVDASDSYDALLARSDIDIVHIAAPVAEMAELAVRSAQAGKHIILGKPMAMNLAEADRIVEAVEQSGVKCLPAQSNTRLRVADLKGRVDRGEIGEIAVIHQTCRWSIAEDWIGSGVPGWFADPAQVPGGAFIDEGIYWVDVFRWLTGSEIVQVDARMANLVHKDIAVEDWGLGTFTFANGVIATLEASWTINAPRRSGPSPKQNSVVRTEIVGTRGRDHRSVVPIARPGHSRGWSAGLGLRATARNVLRPGRSLSADPPDRRARGRPGDTGDGSGGAHHVRGCDGGLRVRPDRAAGSLAGGVVAVNLVS